MSSLEIEKPPSAVNESLSSPFNASTEFILITDHRTKKNKSLENIAEDAEPQQSRCQSCIQSVFNKKTLYKRLPICQWLPKYSRADAIGDLIAGLTVGMTVIPQGLAYSNVAGLPTEFGLYGSFMGCFVYVLLGTCKDSTIGSTAVASLLVFQVAEGVWQRALLLTFLTGLIEIAMAIFKLGFLVEFVSGPVSAGFSSAVAFIVCTSQMKDILGVKSGGNTFLQRWIVMIKNIDHMRVPDALLGFGCIVILLLLRYIGRLKVGPKDDEKKSWYHKAINTTLWFLGVTRNASLVLSCAATALYLDKRGKNPFPLTGFVPAGLPSFNLPPFSIVEAASNSSSAMQEPIVVESFFDMVSNLGSGLLLVPIVAMLENNAVCKAFSKGQPIDATQELFAIGLGNVFNSFLSGYRANGGLSRASVNNASGVRTPLANLYIGMVVVFSLMYLTEFFYYIPKAVLAAVIIGAIIFQIQYNVIVPMWRSKKSDLVPAVLCFLFCLIMPLEFGILVAIGVNLLFILYHSARPKIALETLETSTGIRFLQITPDRCLTFPSVEFVRSLILKSGLKNPLPVVIDCTYIYAADFTAANVIKSLVTDFRKRNQKLIFFNLKPSVVSVFEGLHTDLVLCYNLDALNQELATHIDASNEFSYSASNASTIQIIVNDCTDNNNDDSFKDNNENKKNLSNDDITKI